MTARLSSRTKALLIASGACVVGAVIFIALVVVPGSGQAGSAGASSAATKADLTWLGHALSSGTKQGQGLALAEELRPAYARQPHRLIPVGGHIHILMDTFKAGGPAGAIVEAGVSGQGRLILFLVRERSRWLVYDTEPAARTDALLRPATGAEVSRLEAAPLNLTTCPPSLARHIGNRIPVLLVHGFTSSPQMWSVGSPSMLQVLNKLPQLYVAPPFNYESVNTQWVTNDSIGPDLANDIVCLANASRQAHGSGKVIIVAHSMGGLATRYAANHASNSNEVRGDLGLVVTIGSPSLGSWLSTGDAFHHGWLRLLTALCGVDNFLAVGKLNGLCKLLANSYTPAASAMTPGSTQLAALGPWPRTIPVRTIAGNIQAIDFTLFFIHLSITPNSDAVVSVTSALDGSNDPNEGGGTVTIGCPIWNFPHLLPACWHGGEESDPAVQQQVVSAITQYLAATATVPNLTRPPLSTMPTSYARGVEYTLDPSNKANPQSSSEVTGFNWWPFLGPNGSLGVVRTVAVGLGGVVFSKTWAINGSVAFVDQTSCRGSDEIVKGNLNQGELARVYTVNEGNIPGTCPGITPWRALLSLVLLNHFSYNVVK